MKLAHALLLISWIIGCWGFFHAHHLIMLCGFTVAMLFLGFWLNLSSVGGPDFMLAYDTGLFGQLLVKNTNGATAYNLKIEDIRCGIFEAIFDEVPMLAEGTIVQTHSTNNSGTLKALIDALDSDPRALDIKWKAKIRILLSGHTAKGKFHCKFILECVPFQRLAKFKFVRARWTLGDFLFSKRLVG